MGSRAVCLRCRSVLEVPPGSHCPEDGTILVEPAAVGSNAPLLATTIGGRFKLIGVLGTGGMGAVYRALQEPIGRHVALKVIRPGRGHEDDSLEARFFQEAKAIGRIAHERAVHLYDYGCEEDGTLYMVLELVEGATLKQVMRSEGVLHPLRAASIAAQVLDALQAAHDVGVIHRDVKPQNIMLLPRSDGERVKVLDFGVAKVQASWEQEGVYRTSVGLVCGTPRYMAPEQATEQGAVPASDQYATGIVLYEMLAGHTPFDGRSAMDFVRAHLNKEVPPLPPGLDVPPALERVMFRALDKRPGARFASASEMARALRSIAGETTSRPKSQPVAEERDLPTLIDTGPPLSMAETSEITRPDARVVAPPARVSAPVPPADDASSALWSLQARRRRLFLALAVGVGFFAAGAGVTWVVWAGLRDDPPTSTGTPRTPVGAPAPEAVRLEVNAVASTPSEVAAPPVEIAATAEVAAPVSAPEPATAPPPPSRAIARPPRPRPPVVRPAPVEPPSPASTAAPPSRIERF